MIEIINKPLFLHLVGYLCYWQMGFNSVFKGLNASGFGILGTVLAFIRSPDFIHRLMRCFEKRSLSACLKCGEVPA